MVPSGQTETPSQHSYLHCVKGLLVIGCCQHSRCIKSYGTYHGVVNLGFHLDGLSSIAEDAGDPAPFHPVAADDPRYLKMVAVFRSLPSILMALFVWGLFCTCPDGSFISVFGLAVVDGICLPRIYCQRRRVTKGGWFECWLSPCPCRGWIGAARGLILDGLRRWWGRVVVFRPGVQTTLVTLRYWQSHQSSANNIIVYVSMYVNCVCLQRRESRRNRVCNKLYVHKT